MISTHWNEWSNLYRHLYLNRIKQKTARNSNFHCIVFATDRWQTHQLPSWRKEFHMVSINLVFILWKRGFVFTFATSHGLRAHVFSNDEELHWFWGSLCYVACSKHYLRKNLGLWSFLSNLLLSNLVLGEMLSSFKSIIQFKWAIFEWWNYP